MVTLPYCELSLRDKTPQGRESEDWLAYMHQVGSGTARYTFLYVTCIPLAILPSYATQDIREYLTPPCNMLANTCAALGVNQPIGNRPYTDIPSLPIIYAISVRVLYAKHLCPEAWYIAVPTDRTRAGFRDQALSL